jgi:transcriptional regulator with XRE-family HTH domain
MSFPRATLTDPTEDLEVEVEALQFQVADLIAETMAHQRVTKAELARRLGVSGAHVTQMLSGERNMTLKSLAEALYVLDRRVEAEAVPLRQEPQPVRGCAYAAPERFLSWAFPTPLAADEGVWYSTVVHDKPVKVVPARG